MGPSVFRRPELYPLLMQLNAVLAKWVQRKYRRFQRDGTDSFVDGNKSLPNSPNYFVHWRWITDIGH